MCLMATRVETDKAGQRGRCEGVCGPAHVQFKIRGGVRAVTTEKATFEQRPKLIREGDTTPANRIANPNAKSLSGRSLSLFEAGKKQVSE